MHTSALSTFLTCLWAATASATQAQGSTEPASSPGGQPSPDLYTAAAFWHKSDRLESVVEEAVRAFAEQACRETLAGSDAAERAHLDRTLQEVRRKAQELVTYRIVEGPKTRPGAPGYVVINASLDRARLRALHEQARRAAENRPRKSILVLISEEHRRNVIDWRNTVIHEERPDSKIAAAIEARLAGAGYRVVDGAPFDELRTLRTDFSKLNGDDARTVLAIAARQADIIIRGHAKADGPRPVLIENETWFEWHVDATLGAFRADDGELLFAIPLPDGRRSAIRRVRDAASAAAMEQAGQSIAEEFLRRMSDVTLEASSETKIAILNVPGFQVATAIEDHLRQVGGGGVLQTDFRESVLYMTARLPGATRCFAEHLEQWRDAGGVLRIQVTSVSASTIEARMVVAR